MSETKLKPCPFPGCGNSRIRMRGTWSAGEQIGDVEVYCPQCEAMVFGAKADAARAEWNRRAFAMERLKRIEEAAKRLTEFKGTFSCPDNWVCPYCGYMQKHDEHCDYAILEAALKEIDNA